MSDISKGFAEAVKAAGRWVVAVEGRDRFASSGVHWREGLVVTAEHTLKRDEDISVSLPDGSRLDATLVGRDPGTDLAVLKVESELPSPNRATPEAFDPGSLVLAVARSPEEGLGAALGVVSAWSGPWRTWRGGQVERFLQPDVSMYPGFSGGALIDPDGRLLGVNTSGLSRRMSITLPLETVDRVISEIQQRGHVTCGYLGVGMQPVRLPDRFHETAQAGLMVVTLEDGGPADEGGILPGDVLLTVQDQPVHDTEDVQAVLSCHGPGTPVNLTLLRAGAPQALTVTLGERPRGC